MNPTGVSPLPEALARQAPLFCSSQMPMKWCEGLGFFFCSQKCNEQKKKYNNPNPTIVSRVGRAGRRPRPVAGPRARPPLRAAAEGSARGGQGGRRRRKDARCSSAPPGRRGREAGLRPGGPGGGAPAAGAGGRPPRVHLAAVPGAIARPQQLEDGPPCGASFASPEVRDKYPPPASSRGCGHPRACCRGGDLPRRAGTRGRGRRAGSSSARTRAPRSRAWGGWRAGGRGPAGPARVRCSRAAAPAARPAPPPVPQYCLGKRRRW